MAITPRENRLRAIEFRSPEWIPCALNTEPLYWWKYGDALQSLAERHSRAFLDQEFVKPSDDELARIPPEYEEGYLRRDEWGVLRKVGHGTGGDVAVEHPLADWTALDSYIPPDPYRSPEAGGRDWVAEEARIIAWRAKGLMTTAEGGDLFTFMIGLRGYQNLMVDFATDDPHLYAALDMLVDHHAKVVRRYLDLGVDVVRFHNDLGWQQALSISPAMFRKVLKPRFQTLMLPCREAGAHVYLSSDGYMLDIVDDLVECGITVHDPQIAGNTIAGIREHYRGKMCVRLRLDPQALPFCKPSDVHEMVREVVGELAAPEGGLWIDTNLMTTDVPMENLEAICEAYEAYCFP